MYDNFPYSNFHDLNTDWIVKKIKDVETSEANAKESEENAKTSEIEAKASELGALANAHNAEQSAEIARESASDAQGYAIEAGQTVANTLEQVSLLQSRVDNIIPSGTQTEGNTELLDIRVEYDGTVASSAGNAVRNQIEDINDSLTNLTGNISYLYTHDTSINRNNLPNQQSETNWESVVIPCSYGDVFNVKGHGGQSTRLWMFCDANGTLLTESANSLHTNDFVEIEAPVNSAYLCCNSQYTQIKGVVYKNSFLRKDVQILNQIASTKIEFKTYKGFIGGDGVINPQDLLNSNKKEVYTNLIPVNSTVYIKCVLQYNDPLDTPMWLAVALYDKYGDFIQRIGLVSNIQNRYYFENIRNFIDVPNVAYVAYTYAGYDDSTFTLTSEQNAYINKHYETDRHDLQFSKNNKNINSILHRGADGYPENTLIGYAEGKRRGFDIVECDVRFTSDNVPVLLHDTTINRTARNADGSLISESTQISSITYEQALTYDFGYYKGYTDVKIPSFKEFMVLCKKSSLHPYVEIKAGDETLIKNLVSIVNDCGMLQNVTWIADDGVRLEPVIEVYPKARLGLVVSNVLDWVINRLNTLKTGENEVFAFSSGYTQSAIDKCKNANIPLEIWIADTASLINDLDPYISGIESNTMIAQYELYKHVL